MINLSDIIAGIRVAIAGNTYLNTQLTSSGVLQVSYGVIPQQIGANTTSINPYMAVYSIGQGQAYGQFGDSYLDEIELQFSVWTGDFTTTSNIINALGNLFNNYNLTLTDLNSSLVEMKRLNTTNITSQGQNTNQKYIYQGIITFRITVSGC